MYFNLFDSIRKSKTGKIVASCLAMAILTELSFPTAAYALTSGPAQEEYASFEPVETTDLVDPYTGDFTYNLPVLSVPGPNGGYPINLAYHSGVGMDQEASWVGLGWNINVGAINRQLRGLPDDLNGTKVYQHVHMKNTRSMLLDIPINATREFYGFPMSGAESNGWGLQIYYNNYKGVGYRVSYMPKALRVSSGFLEGTGIGLSFDSQSGLNIEPSLSLNFFFGKCEKGVGLGMGPAMSINSREGLQSLSFSCGLYGREYSGPRTKMLSKSKLKRTKNGNTIDDYQERSSNSSISFPVSSYVPPVTIPVTKKSNPFYGKFAPPTGGNVSVVPSYRVNFPRWMHWQGSYEESQVANGGHIETPAFGYIYSHKSNNASIKDFERADIPYSKKVPNLSPATFTYDTYTIAGQGTGGMFRPYRSDIGILNDPERYSTTEILDLNAEFGMFGGTQYHAGLGVITGEGYEGSGAWQSGNNLAQHLKFHSAVPGSPEYEPFYFQMYGEKTAVFDDENFLSDAAGPDWGNETALRVDIDKVNSDFEATSRFVTSNSASTFYDANGGAKNKRISRQRRATNIENLTTEQAALYGMSKNLQFFGSNGTPVNKFPGGNTDPRKGHTSEISVMQPDGMKYTYGLPAYNKVHENAAFRIDYNSIATPVDLAPVSEEHVTLVKGWNDGSQITPPSNQDLDEFYSITNTPEYAHSWLLTSVVSADYVDLTNDGPSADDLGYWVKFNYTRMSTNYKWRVPFHDASYIPGSSSSYDNTGTYMYGEKELFYLTSIETKTHVAQFTLSPRKDGFESSGRFSTIYNSSAQNNSNNPRGTQTTYRIDKISLYTKEDYNANINNLANATPLKEAHFSYDYSLCSGIPNNSGASELASDGITELNLGGKLTLKKLWFTYGKSTRGELSPYKFEYGGDPNTSYYSNPSYNPNKLDRWGYPKESTGASSYPEMRFPYTNQGTNTPEAYAWHLYKVHLPSGASINIEYEPDDYAYVENKKPMQMYDIRGLGDHLLANMTDPLTLANSYSNANNTGRDNADVSAPVKSATHGTGDHTYGDDDNYRVYFELEKQITANDYGPYLAANNNNTADATKAYFKDKYMRDISKVYFRVNIALLNDNSYDYVEGYADILKDNNTGSNTSDVNDYYGVAQNSAGEYIGYVTLKREQLNKRNVFNTHIHPFQAAAFAYLRASRSELIYGAPTSTVNAFSLVSFVPDIISSAVSFNRYCLTSNFGEKIHLNGRSIIRLYSPDNKYGGGVRVKKLYVEESNFSTGAGTNKYGQVFDYTMIENGEKISSGVAYEPSVGGEESSLREPVDYEESHLFKAAQNLYVENPVLAGYYPGPSVGYRKVTVQSLAREEAGINGTSLCTATPVTVYEFYSPKDFPVYSSQTDLSPDPPIIRIGFLPGIYTRFSKTIARSQGYSIVLNDMAGKMKSTTTYIPADPVTGAKEKILSKQEYIYHTKNNYDPNGSNKLENYVRVLIPEAKCAYATLGESSDIFVDMNENYSEHYSDGLDLNVGISTPPAAPLLLPIPLPHEKQVETSLKTVVTMKAVYKTGILKAVKSFDGQATVTTENLAYDAETGNPIFTKVTNEFEDELFNLSFPGHWYYEGLESAYQNHGISITQSITAAANGILNFPTSIKVDNYFTPGDELWINNNTRATVLDVLYQQSPFINHIQCVLQSGAFVTGTVNSVKVIRSGHRNLAITSVGNIFTNVEMLNRFNCNGIPRYDGDVPIYPNIPGVIRASAMEYSDQWGIACGDQTCGSVPGSLVNPYAVGMKGIWRPYKAHEYREDREQYNNIREDGVYKTFTPFNWTVPANNSAKWITMTTMTKYSPTGFELENKDALGVYSAAIYGYKNSLVTAVGSNARYNEMLFEGFEDYPHVCTEAHWNFPNSPATGAFSSQEAHTGKKSFKVSGTAYEQVDVSLNPQCTSSAPYTSTSSGLELANCGCNGVFGPEPGVSGKEYLISAWVKEKPSSGLFAGVSYNNPRLQVQFYNSSNVAIGTSYAFSPQSDNKIIEGWQRVMSRFTIPAGAVKMVVKLENTGTNANADVFFDDIRFHPYKANMESFVYDPISLRAVAELDANNYATYFIYDEEGALSKTKKETIDGIKTISEGRSGGKQ
jgi:hypothetical protein